MPHMPALRHDDIVGILVHAGWTCTGKTGSHEQFKHSTNPHVVTVADHGKKDIPCGTIRNILKTAGLSDVLYKLQHGISAHKIAKQMTKEFRAHLA